MPCVPAFLFRRSCRARYHIKGNCCDDCCAAYFCTSCVQCQVAREIQEQSAPPCYDK